MFAPPWKSGPSEPALSLPKGPPKPPVINEGLKPGCSIFLGKLRFSEASSAIPERLKSRYPFRGVRPKSSCRAVIYWGLGADADLSERSIPWTIQSNQASLLSETVFRRDSPRPRKVELGIADLIVDRNAPSAEKL
jgi:hypothetical protein